MRDKVSNFSYEICFYGSRKDVCIKSSSHEASNFSAYSNAIFPYFSFLFQWRKKRMRRWVMFSPFRFYKFVKDILHMWHVSTTTVTYHF